MLVISINRTVFCYVDKIIGGQGIIGGCRSIGMGAQAEKGSGLNVRIRYIKCGHEIGGQLFDKTGMQFVKGR